MMHIMTADGGVWLAATEVVGVFRTKAETALIKLENGDLVACVERYAPFVERLNMALQIASGIVADCRAEFDEETSGAPLPTVAAAPAGRDIQVDHKALDNRLVLTLDEAVGIAGAV